MSLSLLLKHLRWSALQCPFQFVVSPLFAGLHPPLADCFNRWLPLYIYLEFMNIYETSTVSYSSWFINPKAPFIGPGLNRFFLNAPSSNQLRSLGIQWLPGPRPPLQLRGTGTARRNGAETAGTARNAESAGGWRVMAAWQFSRLEMWIYSLCPEIWWLPSYKLTEIWNTSHL